MTPPLDIAGGCIAGRRVMTQSRAVRDLPTSLFSRESGDRREAHFISFHTRDVIFRKMTNQNQTDTNEMATKKPNTKPIFILPKNTNIKPNFNIERSQNADKIPRKYQEIWDRNTKYRFGFGIFLVYQIFGYRLTSLFHTFLSNSASEGKEGSLVLGVLTKHSNEGTGKGKKSS